MGSQLSYPAGVAERYQKAMQAEIDLMIKDYLRAFKPVSNELQTMDASIASTAGKKLNELSKKWQARFSKKSKSWVERFTSQVSAFSKKSTESSLRELSGGITIEVPEMPQGMVDKLRAATLQNVSLIKSIPDQFHQRIEGAVMRSIERGGQGAKTVYEEIKEIGGMSGKRAKFIATDQSRKATTAFNLERMKSAGIRKGKWKHSGGSAEPRPIHVQLDGVVFDLDDPPVIDKDGTRGLPGTLPHCKCIWIPVIEFDD